MKNTVKYLVSSLFVFGAFFFASAQENVKKDYAEVLSHLEEVIEYPEEALENEAEGDVMVRFKTDDHKKIQNVRVIGKADKEFATAVLDALLALDKKDTSYMASNAMYLVPVHFSIED